MEGTVISDAVNLASRIEGLTKAYNAPILISDDTWNKLEDPGSFTVRRLDRVKVKGKSSWVDIVEVLRPKQIDYQVVASVANAIALNKEVLAVFLLIVVVNYTCSSIKIFLLGGA